MGALLSSLVSILYEKKLDMVVVGLAGSGKSTFAEMIRLGKASPQVPTIGVSVQTFRKNGVSCKLWDLGGQQEFRNTQQPYDIYLAKRELHVILEQLSTPTPILILANKIDLGTQLDEKQIIEGLNLDYVVTNPWKIIEVSAKTGQNIDLTLKHIMQFAR